MSPLPQQTLPAYGTIRGGKFDGWTYAFVAFVQDTPGRPPAVRLRATRSGWPFPTLVEVPYPHHSVKFEHDKDKKAPMVIASAPLHRA